MELPDTVKEPNEILAYRTIQSYNDAVEFYSRFSKTCTLQTCAKMTAGKQFEYQWADEVKVKTPIEVSAPEYMDYLFCWAQDYFDNAAIFPVTDKQTFSKDFKPKVVNILRRLLRVWGHLYWHHYKDMTADDRSAFDAAAERFYTYTRKETLIKKEELAVLVDFATAQGLPH